jgi:hypothetical protein
MQQLRLVAMKPQIAFLGPAVAGSRSGGKVIVPGFRFSGVGFSFRAVVLPDARCRILVTQS